MKDHTKQKLTFAGDAIKQLITLSTAILTVTVTFKDKILPSEIKSAYFLLVLSLISHIVSVYFGIKALQGFVNVLEISEDDDDTSVFSPDIKDPAASQITAFMIGLGLLVAYLVVSLL